MIKPFAYLLLFSHFHDLAVPIGHLVDMLFINIFSKIYPCQIEFDCFNLFLGVEALVEYIYYKHSSLNVRTQ